MSRRNPHKYSVPFRTEDVWAEMKAAHAENDQLKAELEARTELCEKCGGKGCIDGKVLDCGHDYPDPCPVCKGAKRVPLGTAELARLRDAGQDLFRELNVLKALNYIKPGTKSDMVLERYRPMFGYNPQPQQQPAARGKEAEG